MCGRIASYTPPARLARLLDARLAQGLDPVGHPSWNVTPMRRVYALTGPRASWVIDAYRWGLVPSWSQDPSVGNRLFNARAETVATTPAFRSAFANRRCLVLADGFYEWREARASGASPQPDEAVLAVKLAGCARARTSSAKHRHGPQALTRTSGRCCWRGVGALLVRA